MFLVLPPSQGKTPPPPDNPPFDLASLSRPELFEARDQVLTALAATSAHPDAARLLGVSPGLASGVVRNVGLRGAPAAAVAQVYTGVLYAAAGLTTLTDRQARRAARDVVVISGLWGALSPNDAIPAYRLAMGADVPPLGRLAAFWRPFLSTALDSRAVGDVVVDCRSAPYAAAWRPPRGAEWVAVRVLREVDGVRSIVSHHAKHTRGVLARHLITRPEPVQTAEELDRAARKLVGAGLIDVSLHAPVGRGAATLELVVD